MRNPNAGSMAVAVFAVVVAIMVYGGLACALPSILGLLRRWLGA